MDRNLPSQQIVPSIRKGAPFEKNFQALKLKLGIPLQPQGPKPEVKQEPVCFRCKRTISANDHGWVREDLGENPFPSGHKIKLIPCPVCAPPVLWKREQQHLKQTQLPDYMRTWTFDSYPKTADMEAREQVEYYVAGESGYNNLYLFGDVGRGKTGLAVSAFKQLLAQGFSGLYITSGKYIYYLRQSKRKDAAPDYVGWEETLQRVQVLLLDDLATEQPTQFIMEEMYNLIEARRSRDDFYTIITSNLSVGQLKQYWELPDAVIQPGHRITSRLRESFMAVEVKGIEQREA
jgi:DNA replication protein DnaC